MIIRGAQRYGIHEKRNSTSPVNHVLFCIMYYLNTLITRSQLDSCFKKKTQFHSFILPNRVSEMSAANRRPQTCEKLHLTCGDTFSFFSSGNPSKTLQVLPCNKMLTKKKKKKGKTSSRMVSWFVCYHLGPRTMKDLFHVYFPIFTKIALFTKRLGQFWENLKLILNCPRALAITCLSHRGQNVWWQ